MHTYRSGIEESLNSTKFQLDKIHADIGRTLEKIRYSRGAVAQLVERPLKVPVWCNSTDVGSNQERDMESLSLSLSDHAAL